MNEAIKGRVKDLHATLAELPLVVANNGWDDHALELLGRAQRIVAVLDDEDEDAEELFDEVASEIGSQAYRTSDAFPEKTAEPETKEPERRSGSVGVYVFKDGKLLAGTRITPSGFNKICGPGGLVNNGESAHDAAIREAKEEFGIEPIDIVSFGRGQKGADGYEPELFLCTEYNGDPKCDEVEMTRPEWRTIGGYRNDPDALYAPFKDGIEKLILAVCGDDQTNRNDANSDDVKWITVKGAHIPLDDDGTPSGKVGEKIKSSHEKTAKRSESIDGAMKPAHQDYEYSDGDSKEAWERKNIGKLKPLVKQGGRQAVDSEWRKFRMAKASEDIHELSENEADAVIYDNVSQSVFDGWYRGAGSGYKPKLVDYMLSSKEMRSAGLSLAYENYKNCTDSPLSFKEFMKTPITMFRGEHGQSHTKDDIFSAFSFDRRIAEKFAGKDGKITEAKIRPIDTYGSMRAAGNEAEIWVPSEMVSNGEKNENGSTKSEERGYFDPTVKQLNNVKLGEKIVDEKGVEYTADWRDRNTGKVFWTAEPYKGAGYVDTYSSEEVVSRTRLYGLKLRKV